MANFSTLCLASNLFALVAFPSLCFSQFSHLSSHHLVFLSYSEMPTTLCTTCHLSLQVSFSTVSPSGKFLGLGLPSEWSLRHWMPLRRTWTSSGSGNVQTTWGSKRISKKSCIWVGINPTINIGWGMKRLRAALWRTWEYW